MIEGGSGWMNVLIVMANVYPTLYVVGPVQAVVDGIMLSHYAVTANEKSFLNANNCSTLYQSQLLADDAGFNSGNLLIGLCIAFSW